MKFVYLIGITLFLGSCVSRKPAREDGLPEYYDAVTGLPPKHYRNKKTIFDTLDYVAGFYPEHICGFNCDCCDN